MADPQRSTSQENPVDGLLDNRYRVEGEIGSGGMASVHYGRRIGPHGFERAVAIKRLHPHLCRDPDFVAMFADEARLSASLHHANIVTTFDVVENAGELAIVMEYIHGESLANLTKALLAREQRMPLAVAVTLIGAVLHGLHAAHIACNGEGEPLNLVHRDVSPHNIIVGADGVTRILDFGIAKAAHRNRLTPSDELKGKLAYIAPEQLKGAEATPQTDIYGVTVVLWEALTGSRLFDGPSDAAVLHQIFSYPPPAPSVYNAEISPRLDALVLKGLHPNPDERFTTAHEMARALSHAHPGLSQTQTAEWLENLWGTELAAKAQRLLRKSGSHAIPPKLPPAPPSSSPEPAPAAGQTRRLPNEADAHQPADSPPTAEPSAPEPTAATSSLPAWPPAHDQGRPGLRVGAALLVGGLAATILWNAAQTHSPAPSTPTADTKQASPPVSPAPTAPSTASAPGAAGAALTPGADAERPAGRNSPSDRRHGASAVAPEPPLTLTQTASAVPDNAHAPENGTPTRAASPAQPAVAAPRPRRIKPTARSPRTSSRTQRRAQQTPETVPPKPQATPQQRQAPGTPVANCTPPYEIDARGIKTFKLECL